MPYQANIPLANDRLSQSQQDINGNFQVLGAIGGKVGVNNSSGINVAPGAGFNYLFLTAGPNPPTGSVFGTSNAMFSFLYPTTNQNEIFINKQNQVTQVVIPSTASILSVTSAPAINSNGWTMLPSGILMKWGFQSGAAWAIGNNQVNYPVGGIPAFVGVPFSLQVTIAKAATSGVDVNARIASNLNNNNTDFNVDVRQANGPNPIQFPSLRIFWFAIGRGV